LSGIKSSGAKGKGKEKENLSADDDELGAGMEPDVDVVVTESPRVHDARLVKGIFELVFPRWKDLVRAKGEEDGRPCGLERFDCGMVFRLTCPMTCSSLIIRRSRARLYAHCMQRCNCAWNFERVRI
jgi:Fanconi-associated nuclease 1